MLANVYFFVYLILFFGSLEDDAGGTDGEESAAFDDASFAWRNLNIIHKGACVAVVVAQGVFQSALLVATDIQRAVVQVDAGVNSLKGGVDGIALLISANDVVAHLEGNDLLVVKHILDDGDGADRRVAVG